MTNKELTLNLVLSLMLSANVLMIIGYTLTGILLGFLGILIYTAAKSLQKEE